MSTPRRPPSVRRRALGRRLYVRRSTERPDWIESELLRTSQVALLFQVGRRTVSEWARTGLIPSIITPGGHRRFRARDVRRLLESVRPGTERAGAEFRSARRQEAPQDPPRGDGDGAADAGDPGASPPPEVAT